MQIRSEINNRYREMELHVCNNEMTDEVKSVMDQLHSYFDTSLTGTDEAGNRCILRPAEIFSFYSEGQKVIAMDASKRYTVSRKLYELEEEFKKLNFIRISKSEIVNYRRIRSLDLSLSGTIRVIMKNGYETYSSRRNVARLKELLLQTKKAGGKE
ncbi:MAG: LytTR family transcriptional regulator DNA-binding domain-containing protein [Lachnospiraceae bacterium]|nr:LytTR family transcriptional regulator DNA-binding domain-containing protein [Lachnospiraceae bacterium]